MIGRDAHISKDVSIDQQNPYNPGQQGHYNQGNYSPETFTHSSCRRAMIFKRSSRNYGSQFLELSCGNVSGSYISIDI